MNVQKILPAVAFDQRKSRRGKLFNMMSAADSQPASQPSCYQLMDRTHLHCGSFTHTNKCFPLIKLEIERMHKDESFERTFSQGFISTFTTNHSSHCHQQPQIYPHQYFSHLQTHTIHKLDFGLHPQFHWPLSASSFAQDKGEDQRMEKHNNERNCHSCNCEVPRS